MHTAVFDIDGLKIKTYSVYWWIKLLTIVFYQQDIHVIISSVGENPLICDCKRKSNILVQIVI